MIGCPGLIETFSGVAEAAGVPLRGRHGQPWLTLELPRSRVTAVEAARAAEPRAGVRPPVASGGRRTWCPLDADARRTGDRQHRRQRVNEVPDPAPIDDPGVGSASALIAVAP